MTIESIIIIIGIVIGTILGISIFWNTQRYQNKDDRGSGLGRSRDDITIG